jgi:hypothetical protein
MFKKLIVFNILLGMALHCGCRLGFLDQLYQQRHKIAHALGVIEEIPMTMCNSDYDFEKDLKVEASDDSNSSLPLLHLVKEINLFSVSLYYYSTPTKSLLSNGFSFWQADQYQFTLATSIFHPPSVLA